MFDLDGTLLNTEEGILGGHRYTLEKLGRPPESYESLRRFMGPPLFASFKKFYGMSDEQAQQAVLIYREYYSEKGAYECRVYDGVETTLAALKAGGKKLYLATSKNEAYAKLMLEHFGLIGYFDFVGGSSPDHARADKVSVIRYVMESCSLPAEDSVMIGDSHYDVLGARAAGIPVIGVLYGFGPLDELLASQPDTTVEKAEALLDILV